MSEPSLSQSEFDPYEHIKRLKPGSVLLSKDLVDPNFSETAVLICQHGSEGSYGLVLNRPSHMPISEVFDNPPEWVGDVSRRQRIYIGGPVEPDELQVIQVTNSPVTKSLQIAPEVFLGGYWGDLKDILDLDVKSLRLFLGYSGWAADQLSKEVEASAWEVWDVDVKRLILSPDETWQGGLGSVKQFLNSIKS